MFAYPPTNLLKILRSLGTSRKFQEPALISKDTVVRENIAFILSTSKLRAHWSGETKREKSELNADFRMLVQIFVADLQRTLEVKRFGSHWVFIENCSFSADFSEEAAGTRGFVCRNWFLPFGFSHSALSYKSSQTEHQERRIFPKEEGLGQISLQTSGQKLRSADLSSPREKQAKESQTCNPPDPLQSPEWSLGVGSPHLPVGKEFLRFCLVWSA